MSCPTDFIASVTTASSPMPTGATTLHWPAGSSPYPTQLRRARRAVTPKMVATTKTGMLALAAAGGGSSSRPSHPAAGPPSVPSPPPRAAAPQPTPNVTASIRVLSDADDTPPATTTLCRWHPQPRPSAAKTQTLQHDRHGARGTHANQYYRPRYPFKPAVPSESGQVAQNLALNPHRP